MGKVVVRATTPWPEVGRNAPHVSVPSISQFLFATAVNCTSSARTDPDENGTFRLSWRKVDPRNRIENGTKNARARGGNRTSNWNSDSFRIYIFVLVTFYLMKRERLLLKPGKKYVTDAKDESYPRFWITILDLCFPIRRIFILKKCRKLVSRSYYYYYSFYLELQILSIFQSVLLDA